MRRTYNSNNSTWTCYGSITPTYGGFTYTPYTDQHDRCQPTKDAVFYFVIGCDDNKGAVIFSFTIEVGSIGSTSIRELLEFESER